MTPPERISKLIVLYLAGILLGACVILIPGASFILKNPEIHGMSYQQYGVVYLPMVTMAILVTWFYHWIRHFWGTSRIYYAAFLFNLLYLFLIFEAARVLLQPDRTFVLLLAANLSLGVGFGLLLPSLNIFCVNLFPDHRATVLAGLHGFFGIGASAIPLLVDFFYVRGFWSGSAMVVSGLILVILLLSLVFKITPVEKRNENSDGKHHLSYRGLPKIAYCFIGMVVLYGIAESTVANWSGLYLTEVKNFSTKTASICLSLFWGSLTVGRLVATGLSLKVDARFLLRVSPVVMVIGIIVLMNTYEESSIYVPYIISGLGCSYFFPVATSLVTHYCDEYRDMLSSLMISGIMIGVGLGSTAIGFFRNIQFITLNQAFQIALVCSAALFCISLLLTRRKIP